MEKPNKILVLSMFIIVGFFFSIVFHYVINIYFQLPDNLFGHFVWPVRGVFFEYLNNIAVAKDFFSPFNTYPIKHLPFAYILLWPLSLIANPLLSYFLYTILFLGVFISFNFVFFKCEFFTKQQTFQNVFILTFFSYPFLMALDCGTISLFLFILFAAFAFCYYKNRFLLGSLFLSLLSAVNPLFIVFSSLFLSKKNYKCFFLSVFLSFLFCVLSFVFVHLNPLEQIALLLKDSNLNIINFIYHSKDSLTNISSPFMFVYIVYHKLPYFISLKTLINLYNILLCMFSCFLIFLSVKNDSFWKKLLLLTLLINLIPVFVFDYNWLFLFVPIWFFVNSKEQSKLDVFYTLLFGLLLLPKPYGVYINPLFSIIFISLIVFEQYKKRETNEQT